MKIYFKIAFFMLLVHSNLVLAQSKLNKFEGSLWVKFEKNTSDEHSLSNRKAESDLSKYFNFNSAVDFSKSAVKKKTKNLIKNQSSLFLVYRGGIESETELLTLQKGEFEVTVTSKKIQIDKDIELNKGNSANGMIISCLFSNNNILGKKAGSLTIGDLLLFDKEHKNQLFELIYIPKVLNLKEKNIIESYLSIKYGISLIDANHYYNTKGTKVWDAKENKGFNYRVTGVGKDDTYGLNQKQSGNNQKDGLYMSLGRFENTNEQNKTVVADRTFLIWGDNGKSTSIVGDDNEKSALEKMERIWKIQTTSDSLHGNNSAQLLINKKEMNLGQAKKEGLTEKNHFWLAVDTTASTNFNYASASYTKATTDNEEKLIFDAVKWKNNANSLFTIVKAPDFFVTYDILPLACISESEGKINLKIIGGHAPYTVKIKSEKFEKDITTNNDQLALDHLPNGLHTLVVSDEINTYNSSFSIDPFQNSAVTMEKEYFVENNTDLTISPVVTKSEEIKTYAWYNNDQLISGESTITVENIGPYKLIVTNTNGCEKEFPFEVKNKNAVKDGSWVLYPNPVEFGQNFKIEFHLATASNTTVFIHNLNGKLIKKYNLGLIKDHVLSESILSSGTYLVTISRDGNNETTKLIIK